VGPNAGVIVTLNDSRRYSSDRVRRRVGHHSWQRVPAPIASTNVARRWV